MHQTFWQITAAFAMEFLVSLDEVKVTSEEMREKRGCEE